MAVTMIQTDTFPTEVLQSEKPVLVDFYATWCGPCKMLTPTVNALSEEHPEIKFCKLDVDKSPQIAAEYQVMSIPTLILFKDGQAVNKSVGLVPKAELEAFIGC